MPRAPPPSSCECEIASTRISIRRHVIEHASSICTIGDERDSSASDEMKKFWLVLLLPLLLVLQWGVGGGQSRPTVLFDTVIRATNDITVSENGQLHHVLSTQCSSVPDGSVPETPRPFRLHRSPGE